MPDISTVWPRGAALGDWRLAPPSLRADCDLVTATLISLFTDRRAAAEDVLPDDLTATDGSVLRGLGDRRGWWADPTLPSRIGSRLWLISREKSLDAVLRRAQSYADEALAWLVEDGVAERVETASDRGRDALGQLRADWLCLAVRIIRPRRADFAFRVDWAWRDLARCVAEPVGGSPSRAAAPPIGVTFDATRIDFSLTSPSWDIA